MKECKCGRKIPGNWPMCGECVVASKLPYEPEAVRQPRMLQRQFNVLSRMAQRKELLRQLEADQGTQGTLEVPATRDEQDAMILRAKKQAKQSEARRAKQSLEDWYDNDEA